MERIFQNWLINGNRSPSIWLPDQYPFPGSPATAACLTPQVQTTARQYYAMMRLTGGQRQRLPSPYLHVSLRNRPQLSFTVISHPPQQRNGYSNAAEHLGFLVFIGSPGCP